MLLSGMLVPYWPGPDLGLMLVRAVEQERARITRGSVKRSLLNPWTIPIGSEPLLISSSLPLSLSPSSRTSRRYRSASLSPRRQTHRPDSASTWPVSLSHHGRPKSKIIVYSSSLNNVNDVLFPEEKRKTICTSCLKHIYRLSNITNLPIDTLSNNTPSISRNQKLSLESRCGKFGETDNVHLQSKHKTEQTPRERPPWPKQTPLIHRKHRRRNVLKTPSKIQSSLKERNTILTIEQNDANKWLHTSKKFRQSCDINHDKTICSTTYMNIKRNDNCAIAAERRSQRNTTKRSQACLYTKDKKVDLELSSTNKESKVVTTKGVDFVKKEGVLATRRSMNKGTTGIKELKPLYSQPQIYHFSDSDSSQICTRDRGNIISEQTQSQQKNSSENAVQNEPISLSVLNEKPHTYMSSHQSVKPNKTLTRTTLRRSSDFRLLQVIKDRMQSSSGDMDVNSSKSRDTLKRTESYYGAKTIINWKTTKERRSTNPPAAAPAAPHNNIVYMSEERLLLRMATIRDRSQMTRPGVRKSKLRRTSIWTGRLSEGGVYIRKTGKDPYAQQKPWNSHD